MFASRNGISLGFKCENIDDVLGLVIVYSKVGYFSSYYCSLFSNHMSK
jgi:hypothetical protein